MVGVNKYQVEESSRGIDVLYIDKSVEERQVRKIQEVKKKRDSRKVESTLGALQKACVGKENTMPHILNCVKAYCTVQEICDVMRKEFGIYRDPGMF